MTMPKHAARRDNNEQPLVQFAERLGWWLIKLNEPSDWLGWRAGQWVPVEIKNPDREGRADEFTPKQVIFHRDAKNRGAKVLVWRTEVDVMRDSGARRSA